ncbi:hypothetical protein IJG22_03150 [Candidatus Saccharibacteria bacterium]|nr:hypothetical protein [Candidatus Saccharibacteria bacterium]
MKRKPFQSILTVLLSAGALGGVPCTAPLTYADTYPVTPMTVLEENGTTWWSVEELLSFNQEVEAEKEAECGDNQDCRMEFGWSMIERGPKYSALNNLLEGQFWVTSVNPAAETVKVLFFDDDMMLRHMGIEEKLEIEHLYLGWFDEWRGQIYNYDHDGFTNGTVSGSHPLYDSTTEGVDAIVPWQESELSVTGGGLIYNTTGKLDYALYAKYNMFNAQGHFDYSSCLSAPDYQEGMECQMMISGDQWISYFPPREQINEPEITNNEPEAPFTEPEIIYDEPENPTIEPEDPAIEPEDPITEPEISPVTPENPIMESDNPLTEPESQPTTNPTETITVEPEGDINLAINEPIQPLPSETSTSESTPFEETNPVLTQIIITEDNSVVPKAPETGKSMKTSNHSIEMPWWFIILNILGALFIIWWFMPIRRKNHPKSQKSSKKVLTKKTDCDKMVSV